MGETGLPIPPLKKIPPYPISSATLQKKNKKNK
jgi:hypothetical protein